jgi:S-adenosylmethionine decarboxylase
MNTPLGTHYIVEFYGCMADSLKRAESCKLTFREAATRGNFTVVDEHFHEFSPWGVSGVTVLSESHMSIHSWPEHGYAAIDIFYCGGKVFPDHAIAYFREQFCPSKVEIAVMHRGLPEKFMVCADEEEADA